MSTLYERGHYAKTDCSYGPPFCPADGYGWPCPEAEKEQQKQQKACPRGCDRLYPHQVVNGQCVDFPPPSTIVELAKSPDTATMNDAQRATFARRLRQMADEAHDLGYLELCAQLHYEARLLVDDQFRAPSNIDGR